MIEFLSKIALNYLHKYDLIEQSGDDYDYYKYGIEITISSLINLILILLIGCLLDKILYSVIFLLIFISLRQLTGGYHAKTYFRCNITMCCSFALTAFGTILIEVFPLLLFIIHIVLSTLIELIYCPVENINKPIALNNRNKFKVASLVTSCFLSCIGYMVSLKYDEYGTCMIMTIVIINILIIVSQIEKGVRV